jgi:superoxide dismutase, Fe-Mn family
MNRREALKTTVLATAACAVASTVGVAAAQAPAATAPPAGPFSLPPLPYPFDALEPYIDARTMEIHHDKHHAAYVANLNKAIGDDPVLRKKSLEELVTSLNDVPEKIRMTVRNNAGGAYNHALFWQMMKKNGGGEPQGDLGKAIGGQFGSFAGFKEKFTEAATKVFGSGWAWLAIRDGGLRIESAPNQDSPLMGGATGGGQPILGLDVWEHAYYLKYQNRRPEYIAAWFNVINWDFVAERYAKLKT